MFKESVFININKLNLKELFFFILKNILNVVLDI